jgi:hypothetical protein
MRGLSEKRSMMMKVREKEMMLRVTSSLEITILEKQN